MINSPRRSKAPWALMALAALLPTSAMAQEGKRITNQSLVWFAYNNNLKLSEKWSLVTDIQERRFVNPSAQHQFLVRTKLGYNLGQGWDIGAGGCIFWQSPHDPYSESDLVVPELRPHVEINYKQKVRYFRVNHRYKAEARFYHDVENGELAGGYTFGNYRFRYQLGIEVPLLSSKDKKQERLTLRMNDEIHVNAGSKVVMNTFDQNRIYGGISYGVNANLNVEIGYLNWFQERNSGKDYYSRNIVRLSINHRISLVKKKPADAPKN